MRTIHFFIFIILSIISAQALAFEGVGVTLLHEQIESSPGIHGKFVEIPASHKLFSSPYSSMAAMAQANNATGKVHQNVTVTGKHGFSLVNNTREVQYYRYRYELNTNDGRYFRKIDSVRIVPGGYITDIANSFFYTFQPNPGKWTITAYTDVSGEISSSRYHQATLTITK